MMGAQFSRNFQLLLEKPRKKQTVARGPKSAQGTGHP